MRFAFALLPFLVLASGCATSHLTVASPATLAEANEVLDGRVAIVTMLDGREFASTDVVLGEARTSFVDSNGGEARTIPTDSLQLVSALLASSRLAHIGRRALVGAAPGLAVTGVGLAWMIAELTPGDIYFPAFGPFLLTAGGVMLLTAGTLIGVIDGASSSSGHKQWVVVYRRPLALPDG